MLLKFVFVAISGLAIFISQPCEADERTCDTKECGLYEMCTECEMTPCNTYSCKNYDGTRIACRIPCVETPPTCICKPKYHRITPNAPCTRIKCPTKTPIEPTCDTIKCEANEVCSPCGQTPCNAYDCDNLDGALVNCRGNCKKPACVCESKFHRLTTNGPCVPIICPK